MGCFPPRDQNQNKEKQGTIKSNNSKKNNSNLNDSLSDSKKNLKLQLSKDIKEKKNENQSNFNQIKDSNNEINIKTNDNNQLNVEIRDSEKDNAISMKNDKRNVHFKETNMIKSNNRNIESFNTKNQNFSIHTNKDNESISKYRDGNFDMEVRSVYSKPHTNQNNTLKQIRSVIKNKTIKQNVKKLVIDKDFLIREQNKDPFEIYTILKTLGEGSFGKVYKVENKLNKEVRAMKVINKLSYTMSEEEENEILKEINILKTLDHPNILKIYEYYNLDRKLVIISELCTGGELFDRIVEVKYFTETVAGHIMKQLISATAFCHLNDIIHRDLKPENILIENANERKKDFFTVKIIDFGTSEINKHKMLSEKTGTAYYIAPEVLNNYYNEKCDMWSLGVILYILLCGSPPFSGDSDEEIFEKIKTGEFKFKGSVWKDISEDAIDLINKLLDKNIQTRLSAQEALNHQWFTNMFSDKNRELLELQKKKFEKIHLKEIVNNIKNFRAEKKLQQAALAFIVHNLSQYEEIRELRNVFLAFDLNGDGRLTKDELIEGMSQVMTKGEAKQNVEKIIENIDFDNNGYIEYEEFLRASINKEKLLSKENIKNAFELFDYDKSGYISKEKLRNVLGNKSNHHDDTVWNEIIKEIDLNQDGKISYEEFSEMMYNMVEKNI